MNNELIIETRNKNTNLFARSFWWTIIALFLITLILLILSAIRPNEKALNEAANERAYLALPEKLKNSISTIAPQIVIDVSEKEFVSTNLLIDESLDKAFSPVYQNIHSFADFHYSLMGEYTELGLAATGKLASKIQSILFKGFEESYKQATNNISTEFNSEFIRLVQKESEKYATDFKLNEEQSNNFKNLLTQQIVESITTHDGSTVITKAFLGGTLGVGTTKLIAAQISRKLLLKLGVKYSTKLAAKSASASSTAAIGAAIGSFFPGVGTVIGGVIGGVVGWVSVDKVFLEVDEWMHRTEFEQEIRIQLDEQKKLLKSSIKKRLSDLKKWVFRIISG